MKCHIRTLCHYCFIASIFFFIFPVFRLYHWLGKDYISLTFLVYFVSKSPILLLILKKHIQLNIQTSCFEFILVVFENLRFEGFFYTSFLLFFSFQPENEISSDCNHVSMTFHNSAYVLYIYMMRKFGMLSLMFKKPLCFFKLS